MRKKRLLLTLLLGFAACNVQAELRTADPALNGYDIEVKQDQMQSNYVGEVRQMTLTLINAQGKESVRKLVFEGFEGLSRRDKTKVTFTYPADMKGAALLTHENGEGDDDQWLYLPAVKRTKRIASSNQSGSFMGSEFSYEDLVVRQLDKYNFRYIGDETIEGKDCFVVERIPKNKKSGYSRVVRWRMKDNLQELRTDYYDRKGDLLKTRMMHGHHLVDGFWRVQKIEVANAQTNKKSTLTFDDVKLKVQIPEDHFSTQSLDSAI